VIEEPADGRTQRRFNFFERAPEVFIERHPRLPLHEGAAEVER
jgi:hypothetical protein